MFTVLVFDSDKWSWIRLVNWSRVEYTDDVRSATIFSAQELLQAHETITEFIDNHRALRAVPPVTERLPDEFETVTHFLHGLKKRGYFNRNNWSAPPRLIVRKSLMKPNIMIRSFFRR